MLKTTIAAITAMQVSSVIFNPLSFIESKQEPKEITIKQQVSETDCSIVNRFIELSKYHCDSCISMNHQLKAIHIEVEKKLAEEARIEAERIAKLEVEIREITSRNDRKNNVHFDPYNLSSISNITSDELDQIFISKGKPAMTELSNAFVDAEHLFGVNAFFLAGLVAEESGWTSKPAGGGNNLTGYAVYSSSHYGEEFNSKYANIIETARLIKQDYLTPGGNYYNGMSIWNVNTKYCLYNDMKTTDYNWSRKIISIASDLEEIYHHDVKTLEEVPTI